MFYIRVHTSGHDHSYAHAPTLHTQSVAWISGDTVWELSRHVVRKLKPHEGTWVGVWLLLEPTVSLVNLDMGSPEKLGMIQAWAMTYLQQHEPLAELGTNPRTMWTRTCCYFNILILGDFR